MFVWPQVRCKCHESQPDDKKDSSSSNKITAQLLFYACERRQHSNADFPPTKYTYAYPTILRIGIDFFSCNNFLRNGNEVYFLWGRNFYFVILTVVERLQRFLRVACELRMGDELVDIEMKLCRFIAKYHLEYCTQDWNMAVSEFRTLCNVLNLTVRSLAPNTTYKPTPGWAEKVT